MAERGSSTEVFTDIGYNRVQLAAGFSSISQPFHRIGLVYNPFAGGLKGQKRTRLDEAVRLLERSGAKVHLFATPGPNLAGELACQAARMGCDLVLAAGGDGTINEAVNGIAGTHTVFGVLPSGTANVLANEIGLANRPDRAAAQLLDATPVRIALGVVRREGHSPRHFVLMTGIGLDARIVYELDLDLKQKLGKLAYWHGGFRQVGRPVPRFHVEVNGAAHEASFALVTRVGNYGGDFEIARRVRLTDNDFEVVVFRESEWHDYLRFFAAVVMNRLASARGVTLERAREVSVRLNPQEAAVSSRVYMQIDGEIMGIVPATIGIVPDALTLLIPRRYLDSNGA